MAGHKCYDEEVPVIEAVRGGDRYAFSELVRRHEGWVRGTVFGVLGSWDDVDDVVQQVWTYVWQRIGKLRDATRWRPWLYAIARNAAIDAGRDTTRRRRQIQAAAERLSHRRVASAQQGGFTVADPSRSAPGNAADRVSAIRDKYRTVLAAVQALPALYREPFVLRHLSGWSYREIAEVMRMPVDSVETRLVRARRFLRESLKDKV